MDNYKKALEAETKLASEYFLKSVNKTEQQKFLEFLLKDIDTQKPYRIADIACGGGTLSYHLKKLFPIAHFTLADYLDLSIEISKKVNEGNETSMDFFVDDIYSLEKTGDGFDYTFCWQTLSWLEQPQQALENLIRITKPGGVIYLSALFNINSDVDLYTKAFDLTRESSKDDLFLNYNTYSEKTIRKWTEGKVTELEFFEFVPQVDITYDGRGLGTNTVLTAGNKRIQVSAGILMNWYILKITV
jgi:ubiquinone/menaquinone biosynthesis C-methylase UbiE